MNIHGSVFLIVDAKKEREREREREREGEREREREPLSSCQRNKRVGPYSGETPLGKTPSGATPRGKRSSERTARSLTNCYYLVPISSRRHEFFPRRLPISNSDVNERVARRRGVARERSARTNNRNSTLDSMDSYLRQGRTGITRDARAKVRIEPRDLAASVYHFLDS
jgi:hypothetical protein